MRRNSCSVSNGHKITISEYVAKYNISAAAIFACIVFFVILTYQLYDVAFHKNGRNNSRGEKHLPESYGELDRKDKNGVGLYENTIYDFISDFFKQVKFEQKCIKSSAIPGIECKGLIQGIDDLNNYIFETAQSVSNRILYYVYEKLPIPNSRFYNDVPSTNINLKLTDVQFTNGKMEKGWISGKNDFELEELTIDSNYLGEIGDLAFDDKQFRKLVILSLINTRIMRLRKELFIGLNSLATFLFRNDYKYNYIQVDASAFDPISEKLQALQFQYCLEDFGVLKNITGENGSKFENLLTFDLRFNKLTEIASNSFVKTKNLVQLYLESSSINSIDVEAFAGIGTIADLNLKGNELTTLQNGIFDKFSNKEKKIYIDDNKFNCNCDLEWFKDFYEDNKMLFFETTTFNCQVNGKSVPYKEINFCEENSTGTTSSIETTTISSIFPIQNSTESTKPWITSTTEESTTKRSSTSESTYPATSKYPATSILPTTPTSAPPPLPKIININCSPCEEPNIFDKSLTKISTQSIREGEITYEFYQIEDTSDVLINIEGNVENNSLIYSVEKQKNYSCKENLISAFQLTDLEFGKSYTLCLIHKTKIDVSPQDCTSLTVPEEWKKQAWISNGNKVLSIGLISGISVTLILVTSVTVFYVIRQHPKLIKGNKNVIVVEKQKKEVLMMPEYRKPRYVLRADSPTSICSDGYMTPRFHYYDANSHHRVPEGGERCCCNFCFQRRHHPRVRTVDPHGRANDPPPLPPNHPSGINLAVPQHDYSIL